MMVTEFYKKKLFIISISNFQLVFGKIELEDIAYAISLDGIAKGDELFMHVSKPPKENQQAFEFLNVILIFLFNFSVNFIIF